MDLSSYGLYGSNGMLGLIPDIALFKRVNSYSEHFSSYLTSLINSPQSRLTEVCCGLIFSPVIPSLEKPFLLILLVFDNPDYGIKKTLNSFSCSNATLFSNKRLR